MNLEDDVVEKLLEQGKKEMKERQGNVQVSGQSARALSNYSVSRQIQQLSHVRCTMLAFKVRCTVMVLH